ncbi:MAG: helix-turn-helix transcriptional regulator [Oscillospiraceae bacterium]|nr:helix-turn-helix transcriptional regulator [Oscillospiraceae bacterium]
MLGARIAALRRQAGQSQAELAQILGVSPSAIGMYEQGRREPSGAMLVALARNFGVSTDYLLTGKVGQAERMAITGILNNRLDAAWERIRSRRDSLSEDEVAVLLAAVLTNEG